MAGAPLDKLLLSDLRPRRLRDIDVEHHIEMVADNTQQIVQFQSSMLELQKDTAIANLRAQSHIAQQQAISNQHLENISAGIQNIGTGIQQLNSSMDAGFDAVTRALNEGFQAVAQRLVEQHRTLQEISEQLRRPYQQQSLELLDKAEECIANGMNSVGKDRQDWYEDAIHHLQDVLDNPIGRDDYVAWFQMGWLHWKHKEDFVEAERCFDRARRLSKPRGDLYYAKSLRHLAYMQYSQQRHQDAYQTMQEALLVSDDHGILYDAARYAAKIGNEQEALDLLEKCIRLRPETIVVMFAEEDFQG